MNVNDLLKLERNKAHCNWIGTYGFVEALARPIGAARVCEVGVAYGYHAEHILDHMPEVEYQGVDPYRAGYDPTDCFETDVAAMYEDEPQQAMDRLFLAVNCKLGFYGGRANLLRKSGARAAAQFSAGCFDVVYIDGDHTYDGVMGDLRGWFGKVRSGGILCGDDFNWPSVRSAVMDFMTDKNLAVIGHSSAGAPQPEKWSVVIP